MFYSDVVPFVTLPTDNHYNTIKEVGESQGQHPWSRGLQAQASSVVNEALRILERLLAQVGGYGVLTQTWS